MDHNEQGSGIILRGRHMKFKALELISFQNDDFGARLEIVMTELHKKIRDNVYPAGENIRRTQEVKQLEQMTKERLGLTVSIETNEHLAAIIPFYPNRHHIFLSEFWRGNISLRDQNRILDRKDVQHGTVNTDKARLTGIFSEYVNETFMHFRDLVKYYDLTPPEMTAVYLHELGHGWDGCEYADRLESNNQVIAEVFRHITDRGDKTDMKYVYKELRKVNEEITEKEIDSLVNGNKVIAGYTWFKVCVGGVNSQMSNKTYDKTSFEAASDSFANRFGYGRAIVTALEKLHKDQRFFMSSKTGAVVGYIGSAIANCAILGLILTLIGAGSVLVAVYLSFFLAISLRMSGSDLKDLTYDELKVRYGRIRNDMIEFLKRSNTPDEKMKEIILSIKEVDSIMETIGTGRTFLGDVADIMFSGASQASRSIKEQQLLENMISNDLFLASSELKLAVK